MTEIIVRSLDLAKDPYAIMNWPDSWPVPGPGEQIMITGGIINNSCAMLQEFEIVKRTFIPLPDNPQIEVFVRKLLKDLYPQKETPNEKPNRHPFRKSGNFLAANF